MKGLFVKTGVWGQVFTHTSQVPAFCNSLVQAHSLEERFCSLSGMNELLIKSYQINFT
jgi:hypothetical protein